MIKIIFKIDKEQDSRNWDRVMTIKNIPYGLVKKKGDTTNKNKMIKDFSGKEIKELRAVKKRLEKYFKKDGQEIFKAIEAVTKKPIYTKEFHASFTSAGLRPYDIESRWFMVPATEDFQKQITDICHELLHLQISHYYKESCLKNGLTKKQFLDLNEILTFLLNEPEFKKFNLIKDKGYPGHREIRKKLKKSWEKEKNIKKVLEFYF